MGKGFNNYMCKKFFHPASRDNLKRVWMAEQQTAAYKQKQEELKVQYEKEQDLYTNKAMMSKESKEKLSVNFLYEPPPGTKKDREREDDEPEFKFEWQRKYNAPRESYCKGDQEIRDQPFGIQVRNVRCIKCHKWGHINTDKECPMYNQAAGSADGSSNLNPSDLIRQMREDGLAMKKGAVGLLELPNGPSRTGNHQLIPSSSEDEDHINESELKFLEGLSTKKKLKLLRKLEKMEKKKRKKKKEKNHERMHGGKMRKDSDSSDSDREISRKKLKKEVKSKASWVEKVPLDQKAQSSHYVEKKDFESDLYTVLGRKMDFEGPPQRHSQGSESSHKTKSKRRNKESWSTATRSRSRSPTQFRQGYNVHIKEDPDGPREKSHKRRRSRSVENKERYRSASPKESRNRDGKGRKRREQSPPHDKYQNRSRSRSREPYGRSRSQIQRSGSKY